MQLILCGISSLIPQIAWNSYKSWPLQSRVVSMCWLLFQHMVVVLLLLSALTYEHRGHSTSSHLNFYVHVLACMHSYYGMNVQMHDGARCHWQMHNGLNVREMLKMAGASYTIKVFSSFWSYHALIHRNLPSFERYMLTSMIFSSYSMWSTLKY